MCGAWTKASLLLSLTFPTNWRELSAEVEGCHSSTKPPESRHSVTWQEYRPAQLAWRLAPSHLKSIFREGFLSERGSPLLKCKQLWEAIHHTHLGLNPSFTGFPPSPAEMKVLRQDCDWGGGEEGGEGRLPLGAALKQRNGPGTQQEGMRHGHMAGCVFGPPESTHWRLPWVCIGGGLVLFHLVFNFLIF